MQPSEHFLHYGGSSQSPLGSIALIASITNGHGVVPATPLRIYGSYALVVITQGKGSYQDANGTSAVMQAGDALLVHPALPHTYSPSPGETWDEFYLVFSGPAFDAWHALGLFNPQRPLYTLNPLEDWLKHLRSLAQIPDAPAPAAGAVQVCRLLTMLTEIVLSSSSIPEAAPAANEWLSRACLLLGSVLDSGATLETLTRPLGIPFETFRRRFTRELGIPPAQYRAGRVMETACHLMQYTSMTGAQIAEHLRFSDEYHFSRRFKQLRGETPTQFRRRLAR